MSKVTEIPTGKRTPLYRFFEILPGILSYGMVILLVVLSAISPIAGSVYLLLIVIMSLVKAIGVAFRTVQGYKVVKKGVKVNWRKRLEDLEDPNDSYSRLKGRKSNEYQYDVHLNNLCMMAAAEEGYFPKPSQVYHAVIITMYNAKVLEKNYKKKFGGFILAKHPADIPGEVVGKGGNITNAGRVLSEYVKKRGLRYGDVIVTTLDCDNRPHPCYFDQVAYEFIVREDRKRLSYQPVSLFTNNIWDAPAVTRVVACTNSFWNLICTMRPHVLRNFASHSQPLDALVEMNFWSTRTIVEDGHQYWRSLFYFDGVYDVVPIRAPIYQDAVLSKGLFKTLKAQWVQLRRWDYGASDVAYVGTYMFSKQRTVCYLSLVPKFIRLLDGHVTLAAIAPIVAFGGWVPLMFQLESRDLLSHNLPMVVSYIQTFAACMLSISILLSLKLLPPRPARYKKTKKIFMVIQWIISPIIAIVYSSFCAFYSQTRLLLGLYMEKFDVTDKAVKK